MKTLKGISASPGISIGEIFLHKEDSTRIPHYPIERDLIPKEMERFQLALAKAIEDIELLKKNAGARLSHDEVHMLDTHLLMLTDPDFSERVYNEMRRNLVNVEYALSLMMKELISKLSLAHDEYLRERTADFHDVGKRVLAHLTYDSRRNLVNLDREVVLVCRDLLPSDAIGMDKHRIKGLAMDGGGKTSHTAILARAFEIPAVLGLSEVSELARDGVLCIIDGNKGQVILEPDESTIELYTKLQKSQRKRELQLLRLNDLSSETSDGKIISLNANIEIPEEVESVLAHGASGVGLFRSEFLFLRSTNLPDEEEQYEAYSRVLSAMGNRPVTIRTLDIGGDKLLRTVKTSSLEIAQAGPGYSEKNPLLGWRAIRYCLTNPELFRTQLRAILRASVHGNLKIMFPLISGVDELMQALAALEATKQELRREKIPFKDTIEVGIMIEVPSAAMTSDILAKHVDFFSIGTNDLIQYTIAVDRGNEHIAYLYQPLHPGVLRMIRLVVDNAHREGIPVAMCGEMAGDPLYTLVLLGLGLDELSMSSVGLPEVKRIVRMASLAEAEEFIGRLWELGSSNEIQAYVRKKMEQAFDITTY